MESHKKSVPLTSAKISSLWTSYRNKIVADLGVLYSRLPRGVAYFLSDGANIMIDNGWMKQPPAVDRKVLAD